VRKGGTILLVEDEADIADLVRAYLEQDGFQVIWTTHGTDGLQAFEQNDIRLAILDLHTAGAAAAAVVSARTPRWA
jgi:two-component system OmpR family response regulator